MARANRTESGSTFNFLVALAADDVKQLDEIVKETRVPRVALVRAAIETFLAERGGRKLAVDLPDDLRVDLAALQDAMDGAPVERMVARALREYVDRMLKENIGIGERFTQAREQISEHIDRAPGKVVEFRRTRIS